MFLLMCHFLVEHIVVVDVVVGLVITAVPACRVAGHRDGVVEDLTVHVFPDPLHRLGRHPWAIPGIASRVIEKRGP